MRSPYTAGILFVMDEAVELGASSANKEKCPFETDDVVEACRYERAKGGEKERVCYSATVVHVKEPTGMIAKRYKISFDFLGKKKPVKYGKVAWHPASRSDTWHLESLDED